MEDQNENLVFQEESPDRDLTKYLCFEFQDIQISPHVLIQILDWYLIPSLHFKYLMSYKKYKIGGRAPKRKDRGFLWKLDQLISTEICFNATNGMIQSSDMESKG